MSDLPPNSPGSVDYTGQPFDDPDPPSYENGLHPSNPVIDHHLARALGGPDTDDNTKLLPLETNARKGGLEGAYLQDRQNYMDQGLTQEQAEYVLQGERDYLVTDVHARPVDPFKLDELPNQEMENNVQAETSFEDMSTNFEPVSDETSLEDMSTDFEPVSDETISADMSTDFDTIEPESISSDLSSDFSPEFSGSDFVPSMDTGMDNSISPSIDTGGFDNGGFNGEGM